MKAILEIDIVSLLVSNQPCAHRGIVSLGQISFNEGNFKENKRVAGKSHILYLVFTSVFYTLGSSRLGIDR